jgi:hypothetical protein
VSDGDCPGHQLDFVLHMTEKADSDFIATTGRLSTATQRIDSH